MEKEQKKEQIENLWKTLGNQNIFNTKSKALDDKFWSNK